MFPIGYSHTPTAEAFAQAAKALDFGLDPGIASSLEQRVGNSLQDAIKTTRYQLPALRDAQREFDNLYFGSVLGSGLAYGNKESLAAYTGLSPSTVFRRQEELKPAIDFNWFYPGKKPGQESLYRPELVIASQLSAGPADHRRLPAMGELDAHLQNLYAPAHLLDAATVAPLVAETIASHPWLTPEAKDKATLSASLSIDALVKATNALPVQGVNGYTDVRLLFLDAAYSTARANDGKMPYARTKTAFLRRYFSLAVETYGSVTDAARGIGISRQHLYDGLRDATQHAEHYTGTGSKPERNAPGASHSSDDAGDSRPARRPDALLSPPSIRAAPALRQPAPAPSLFVPDFEHIPVGADGKCWKAA